MIPILETRIAGYDGLGTTSIGRFVALDHRETTGDPAGY
jgi:hypothetical protein